MEKPIDDVSGLSIAAAKEYIYGFISTIKLNEKIIADLETEAGKWRKRADLARSMEEFSLSFEAEQKAEEIEQKLTALQNETTVLKNQAAKMTRQLPGLAARERSVDPDLLVQELLIAAGFNPGDEEKIGQDKKFADLEKNAAAHAALKAMKEKLAGVSGGTPESGAP